MSDEDNTVEEDDEDLDEEMPDEEIDGEGEISEPFDVDEVGDDEDDDEDEEDDVSTPARPAADDDDDEDEDDVEADLDAILKDRIAAGDDDDEDEDEDGVVSRPANAAGKAGQVQARQDNEFSCPNCFLLVISSAVRDGECPHCGGPVGKMS